MRELSDIEEKSNKIQIPIGHIYLNGDLDIPKGAKGIVVFAYGSGSKGFSQHDEYLAQQLKKINLGTLVIDLLTVDEGGVEILTRNLHFDIKMLSKRLIDVSRWVLNRSDTKGLNLGYFGTGTGTAAALIAAREFKDVVKAVVSKGGRPDLAEDVLMDINVPTLFIVVEREEETIDYNKWALERMVIVDKELKIIPNATNLFEAQGALEEIAHMGCNWFKRYLL